MAQYVYPAIFHKAEEGGYWIDFPDIKGCITEGDTLAEGMIMAQDALSLMLCSIEDSGETIPSSSLEGINITNADDTVHYIACDTDVYRSIITNENSNHPNFVGIS